MFMFKGKFKNVLPVMMLGLASAGAQADIIGFDITLDMGSGLSSSQKEVFNQAELFWESSILGYEGDIRFNPSLTITADAAENDGVGGVLGSAGPRYGYNNIPFNGKVYTASGEMSFDSADIDNLESNGQLFDVIVHEMAHVLGFGTLWEANGLYVESTGQYTGESALAAYQASSDPTATYVPIELEGGNGTADGHWDEEWLLGGSELMTGWLEGETTLSDVTLAQFRDLGYLVVDYGEDLINDVPAPMIGGLILCMFALRNKKKTI
jgi:hypothetical protein